MLQHDTFIEGILDSVQSDSEKCETIERIAQMLYHQSKTQNTEFFLSCLSALEGTKSSHSVEVSYTLSERSKGSLVMKVPRRIYFVLFDGCSVGTLIKSIK